jgi:chemotaxis protein histidine kinase CheA
MKPHEHVPADLQGILGLLRRRQRLLSSLRFALHGLLVGMLGACLFLFVRWLVDGQSPRGLLLVAGIGIAASALVGAAVGAILAPDNLRLARALDAAAQGHDRFASALQLASHSNRARAALVIQDAISHVGKTPAAAALPLRVPRSARWLPGPLVLLAAILLLLPSPDLKAAGPAAPEIAPEEWSQLHDEFKKELAQLPRPETAEEEELLKEFEKLAELLRQKPEKKHALAEIARLSDKVERQRRAISPREQSMKAAARAVASSEALKKFASQLKQGEYSQAAKELRQLSSDLKEGKLSPDASEFENISSDLQRLASELAQNDELTQECENSASAAASMNKDQLAEALKRLAEQMEKNAENMSQCDRMGNCKSLLDELKKRMNQCKGGECEGCDGEGCGQCNGQGKKPGKGMGGGKGGLKAGWGSAANWQGGAVAKHDETRTPELSDAIERQGANTTFKMVSPDEKAQSGLKYDELYAEFVQKAEADLDLESVPVAYRDYLRRYFNSIRPQETPEPAEEPAKAP